MSSIPRRCRPSDSQIGAGESEASGAPRSQPDRNDESTGTPESKLSGRKLAVIKTYFDLQDLFLNRIAEIGTDYEAVDEYCGFATNYCAKLLSQTAMRCFGPMSLDALLTALGLTLVAIENPATTARAKQRLAKRKFAPYSRPVVLRFSRAHYRRMARARMAKVSPERRSAIARNASLKRWSKPRIEEIKPGK
jgi:hypothetical protein